MSLSGEDTLKYVLDTINYIILLVLLLQIADSCFQSREHDITTDTVSGIRLLYCQL
jgi:hypothetical protein